MQTVVSDDDPAPQPPRQPELDECCRSGCSPCVFDRYDEAMERYRIALKAWQARHAGAGREGADSSFSIKES